jgi:hypothetical protein
VENRFVCIAGTLRSPATAVVRATASVVDPSEGEVMPDHITVAALHQQLDIRIEKSYNIFGCKCS